MATAAPAVNSSADHLLPANHPSPTDLPPPSYSALHHQPQPPVTTSPSQRSVRFRSPPAHPPRDAPDNHSLLPPYTPRSKDQDQYKGHRSEEEYLAALRAWVEERALMEMGEKSRLEGFYGRETLEECIVKNPKLRDKSKRKERGEGKKEGTVEERGNERGLVGRRKSFGLWFSGKRTC